MRVIKAFINAFFVSNPWRPYARDVRGKERPIHRLSNYLWKQGRPGYLPRATFRRIRESLVRAGYREGLGSGTPVLAAMSGVFFVLSVWTLIDKPSSVAFLTGTMSLVFAFAAKLSQYRVPRVSEEVLTFAFLRERHCPVCAFSLREIPPADRGIVICPECGGHWVLPAKAPA